MEHLSQSELALFASGRLPPARMLACDAHLASCDTCRAAFSIGIGCEDKLESLMDGFEKSAADHLTYDQVRLLAEGKLAPEQARIHAARCESCANEVADLREFALLVSATPSDKKRPWWKGSYGAIAASLLLAASGFLAWRISSRPHDRQVISSIPATTPGENIPPQYQALVAEAVANGRLPVKTAFPEREQNETLLAPATSQRSFRLLEPANVIVLADSPVFTWQPVSENATYTVSIYERGYRKVRESEVLHSTSWTPAQPLARDVTYTWSVTANDALGLVRSPAPPQAEVRFKVMSQASAAELAEARSKYSDNHLLLAVLYAKQGDVPLANAELEAMTKEGSKTALAARLRDSLVGPQPCHPPDCHPKQ